MNAHLILDKILNLSFRTKAGLILVLLAVFAAAEIAVYRVGINAGDARAKIRYTEKEKEFQARNLELEKSAADHLESEKRLAVENELLKNTQKLQAQISTERDSRIRQTAQENLNKIYQDKEKQLNEIDNLDGFDANICALCADYNQRAGGKGSDSDCQLSAAFCGECPVPK